MVGHKCSANGYISKTSSHRRPTQGQERYCFSTHKVWRLLGASFIDGCIDEIWQAIGTQCLHEAGDVACVKLMGGTVPLLFLCFPRCQIRCSLVLCFLLLLGV